MSKENNEIEIGENLFTILLLAIIIFGSIAC